MGNQNSQPSAPATTAVVVGQDNQNSHATTNVVMGQPVPSEPAPAPAPTAPEENKKLDLVFTFDCTGSMGSYIQSAKQNMELIARRLSGTEGYDFRFGLCAYRDHPPQDQTFVTKTFPFSSSVSDMQAHLRTLSAQGGGDGPEAVAAALHATLHMGWRPDATKIVILIADAPPHGLGESGDGFPDGAPDGIDPLVVLDQMSQNGICIYSVGCQPALSHYRFAVDFFVGAANRTNGQAVSLGSAASLADVILGGAVEEMDLQQLAQEMAHDVQQLRSAAPDLTDEMCTQQVYEAWQKGGKKTRQMRGHTKLSSAYASHITEASSLSSAKVSLAAAAPPPPKAAAPKAGFGGGGGFSFGGKKKMVKPPCAAPGGAPPGAPPLMMMRARRSSSPTSPITEKSDDDFVGESVGVEEDMVSYEQVSRLYGQCQKKGIF